MCEIIRDILAANRAAVTKLLPRARRLAHVVVDGPEARKRQLREFAEAIYIAERAIDAGAVSVVWHPEEEDADWGDCEVMPEGTYSHEWLELVDDESDAGESIDTLGGIIIPLKGETATRANHVDQMMADNYRAIARAYLTMGARRLSNT